MQVLAVFSFFCAAFLKLSAADKGRCYLQDLKIKTGVSINSSNVTASGERLDVKCKKGYTADEEKPMCVNGEWREGKRACKERNCTLRSLEHGTTTQIKLVKERFDWKKFRWETRTVYEQVRLGSPIAPGSEFNISCADGYSFRGTGENNVRIRCKEGELEPYPVCRDSRCFLQDLKIQIGISIKSSNVTESGERLDVKCIDGYTADEKKPMCVNGEWIVGTGACKERNCILHSLEHGTISPMKLVRYEFSWSRFRWETKIVFEQVRLGSPIAPGSEFNMSCVDGYSFRGTGENNVRIRCKKGRLEPYPVCHESRCYLQDLEIQTGISIKSSNVTESGERLDVKCKEGYTSDEEKPMCVNGKWREGTVACKERNCILRSLEHGTITQIKLVNEGFNWRKFRWGNRTVYEQVQLGSPIAPGSKFNMSCVDGYSFRGTGENNVRIRCKKGRLEPYPVCFETGTNYKESSSVNDKKNHSVESHMMENGTHRFPAERETERAHVDPSTTSINPYVLLKRITQRPNENSEQDECTCEITVTDDELIAYDNYTRLGYKSKVKNGSMVNFQCRNFGVFRLRGPKSLMCTDCRTWHSSEFPTCLHPERGDALILFDKGVQVSPEGILEVNKSTTFRIQCISNGIKEYPTWRFPQSSGANVSRGKMEQNGEEYYISLLDIHHAEMKSSGNYSCSVGNFRPNVLSLHVIDPFFKYPQFSERNFSVVYDEERKLTTKAMTCPELKESDLLRIVYSGARKIDSLATFHCLALGARSRISYATCLPNRTWSDETPFCKLSSCPVESLFHVIPKGVFPRIEDIKNNTLAYGSKLRLMCEDGLALIGTSTATCGKEGIWEVGNVQCMQGCLPIEKSNNSSLIIRPEKESYRFGDMITFSCPRGFVLTNEVQIMMCIQDGWSDREIPDCKVLDVKKRLMFGI